MKEEDKEKTAFSTVHAHYQFKRMPFGVTNGTRQFCRIMHTIFNNLSFCEIYVDNLTVHSKTIDDMFDYLQEIFKRLQKHKLHLNPEKCVWFKTEIKILGHIIGNHELKMDTSKCDKVKNWP